MAIILKDAVQDAAFKVLLAVAAPGYEYSALPEDVQNILLRQFITSQLNADAVTRDQFLTTIKGVL